MNAGQRFIAVEGPIGVGKTTLARRLAGHYGAALLLEHAEENPFLERFYRDPVNGALPAQLYFLFQRARQFAELRQSELFRPMQVADFMLQKDRLFARANLMDEEYQLYNQVYARLTINAPRPDLVLYLQAPVKVLLERVRRRAIAYEQAITAAYLETIASAYMDFFMRYDETPLLIVNTEHVNLADGEADFNALVAMVEKHRGGRHYFNPMLLEGLD